MTYTNDDKYTRMISELSDLLSNLEIGNEEYYKRFNDIVRYYEYEDLELTDILLGIKHWREDSQ